MGLLPIIFIAIFKGHSMIKLIAGINSGLASVYSPMRFSYIGPKQYSACFSLHSNGKLKLKNIVFKGCCNKALSLAALYYFDIAEDALCTLGHKHN